MITAKQFISGTKVVLDDGSIGIVQSSVDLNWLNKSNGESQYSTTVDVISTPRGIDLKIEEDKSWLRKFIAKKEKSDSV